MLLAAVVGGVSGGGPALRRAVVSAAGVTPGRCVVPGRTATAARNGIWRRHVTTSVLWLPAWTAAAPIVPEEGVRVPHDRQTHREDGKTVAGPEKNWQN